MRQHGIIIAIDGPTASGKSSTAKAVAAQLGYRHLNTGAMYRAFALYCKQWGVSDPEDENVAELLERVYIDIDEHAEVLLDGKNIMQEILAADIATLASSLSTRTDVRQKLVSIQQEIGRNGAIVLDGRDIGTVVFPDAELKIFLVADPEIRAKRRYNERSQEDRNMSLSQLEQELKERDERDMNRVISPLRQADDAIIIDTGTLSFEEQVARIVALAKDRIE